MPVSLWSLSLTRKYRRLLNARRRPEEKNPQSIQRDKAVLLQWQQRQRSNKDDHTCPALLIGELDVPLRSTTPPPHAAKQDSPPPTPLAQRRAVNTSCKYHRSLNLVIRTQAEHNKKGKSSVFLAVTREGVGVSNLARAWGATKRGRVTLPRCLRLRIHGGAGVRRNLQRAFMYRSGSIHLPR